MSEFETEAAAGPVDEPIVETSEQQPDGELADALLYAPPEFAEAAEFEYDEGLQPEQQPSPFVSPEQEIAGRELASAAFAAVGIEPARHAEAFARAETAYADAVSRGLEPNADLARAAVDAAAMQVNGEQRGEELLGRLGPDLPKFDPKQAWQRAVEIYADTTGSRPDDAFAAALALRKGAEETAYGKRPTGEHSVLRRYTAVSGVQARDQMAQNAPQSREDFRALIKTVDKRGF